MCILMMVVAEDSQAFTNNLQVAATCYREELGHEEGLQVAETGRKRSLPPAETQNCRWKSNS